MIYIGIDPGLNGGVGVIFNRELEDTVISVGSFDEYIGRGCALTTVHVWDTPTTIVTKAGKNKRRPLVGAMALLLKPFANRKDVLAVLEDVHAMPQQGVSSTFTFGEGKGIWEGILGAFDIPFDLVSPQAWKKEMGLDKDKNASRAKAVQLFPNLTEQLARVKDDGRAEAILMAEYGRRLHS